MGCSVRVIALSPLGKSSPGWAGKYTLSLEMQRVDGVEFYRLQYFSLSNLGKKPGINQHNVKKAMEKYLSTITDGFRPDVIHAHSLNTSEIALWLKNQLGCPLVITTHGSDTSVPFREGQFKKIQQSAAPADAVVAVSSSLQRKLLVAGVQGDIHVILNGVSLPASIGKLPKRRLSFMQAGNFIPQKKFDITIRAFAKLHQIYPEAELAIAGHGPEERAYKKLCQNLKIGDAVRFLGFLPNPQVLERMSQTQFFIMPSVREGFGMVYLEAMSCGCITIGTEGEGIADFIISGKNGILVPPDEPDAIVAAVESCLSDPAYAASLAEQGRVDAGMLTWEKNAKQYLMLFEKLIRENEAKENV